MSTTVKLERNWTAHGLDCATLLIDLGAGYSHRCGYVRVGEDHPWFGREYDDESVDVDAHGGLTFSRPNPAPEKFGIDIPDGWWFGFDCAHLGDTLDVWTEDAVAEETTELAERLAGVSA